MAIITPLKKIFNWQTASEKIPYKVYTAYITVDDSENMYASQVLENTIGAVSFLHPSPNFWQIKLPYAVPRLKIMIPGFGDYWWNNNATIANSGSGNLLTMYPGVTVISDPTIICNGPTCLTDNVEIYIDLGGWRTFFVSDPTGPATSYPIEIRVYN